MAYASTHEGKIARMERRLHALRRKLFEVDENESSAEPEQRFEGIPIDRGWNVMATSELP